MFQEFIERRVLDIMPHGVYKPGVEWNKERSNFDISSVPPEVQNRANSNEIFTKGKRILGTNRCWEYYIPKVDKPLKKGVIVARDIQYPLNRIIGTEAFVSVNFAAYQILDNVCPGHPFRHMDLIESRDYNEALPEYDASKNGFYWTQELLRLEDLQIDQMAEKYSKREAWNELKPDVGIQSDMPHPAFFLYSFNSTSKSFTSKAVIFASAILHDYSHHALFKSGYNHHGTKAEALCLTNQLNFISETICRYYSSVYRKRIPISWKDVPTLISYMGNLNTYLQENLGNNQGHLNLAKQLWGYDALTASKGWGNFSPEFDPFLM